MCVVKNLYFGSGLGYSVFLSEMSEFEQNICLFLKTMGGLGMFFMEEDWELFAF